MTTRQRLALPVGQAETTVDQASAGSRRLTGVDVTRSLALFGMMAVHTLPLTGADGAPTAVSEVFAGRSAATFAVLAGVGLALASGRTRPPTGPRWVGVTASVVVRALLIGGVGLLIGESDSGVAVILPYYALFFLLALPVLRLRAAAAATVAVGAAVVMPVLSHLLRPSLAEPFRENPTVSTLLEQPGDLLVVLLLTGYYPALVWLAYLAAGVAVGRLELARTRVQVGLTLVGAGLLAGGHVLSGLLLDAGGRAALATATGLGEGSRELAVTLGTGQFGTTPTDTAWWLVLRAPHTGTPLDLAVTTGSALLLLGVLLLLTGPGRASLLPFAAAGSMTLTLYSAHVVLRGTGVLPEDATVAWLLQVAACLVLAALWRTVVGRGPLEAALAAAATRVRRSVTAGAGA